MNGRVSAVVEQPDGKIIVGGEFLTVHGAIRNRIARLHADGSVDPTFDPGLGADGQVSLIFLQSNGKILIGGNFTHVGGVTRKFIARLNGDGTLDPSFDPGNTTDAFSAVEAMTLQEDGKILLGGGLAPIDFEIHGRGHLLRLHANGSLDETFQPRTFEGSTRSASVKSTVCQPDGKILVGGYFQTMGEIELGGIVRLNADGSHDATFDAGTAVGTRGRLPTGISSMALQSDGKVLLGGNFTTIDGTNRHELARLESDGKLDLSFDPGSGPGHDEDYYLAPWVTGILTQPDGKILVYGEFSLIDGISRLRIARLNSNGSVDSSFDPAGSANAYITCLGLQSNGSILVGGRFITFNGVERNNLCRLNADGSFDAIMIPGTDPGILAPDVTSLALQPDGKVLVGLGNFYSDPFAWEWVSVTRLHADGSWDDTFDPGTGADGPVWSVALQPDGKVLLAGGFNSFDGTNRYGIARLHPHGGLDETFVPELQAMSGDIRTVAVQPDGKVLIGGGSIALDGTNHFGITRLNVDGTLDETFQTGSGANGEVLTIVLQEDGKILLGGSFTNVNGMAWKHVGRLNGDGTPDLSLTPGAGVSKVVRSMAIQPDGKILVVGEFGAARLHANGSVDGSFQSGSGAPIWFTGHGAYCVALQADGKVLMGGRFFNMEATIESGLVRLNGDGSDDQTFAPSLEQGVGAASAFALALQSSGRLLAGGNFTGINGALYPGIARFLPDPPKIISGPKHESEELVCRFSGILGVTYTLEYRETLSSGTWEKLRNVTATNLEPGSAAGVIEVRDSISAPEGRYYRLVDPAY